MFGFSLEVLDDYLPTEYMKENFIQEYSKYIDEEKLKTANYNKSLRENKQVGGNVKGSSDAVRKYQQMLNDKYGANLVVDGVWGKNTQSLYNRYLKEK